MDMENILPEEEITPPEERTILPDESAGEEPAPDEKEWTQEEIQEYCRKRSKQKRIFRGALRFYTVLFAVILAILILLCCLMTPLRTLLTQYEAAQPQNTVEEVYQLLFSDPDWALLYDMAGIQATEFEGRDEYVAYMEAKVGDTPLRYVETPTGSTALRRYSVLLENEEVASFTMVALDDGISTFDRWTFGEVEVYFQRCQSVTVNIMPGNTVYINNIPLDETYTTMRLCTPAEAWLPEGLHGYRWEQQQITGLLIAPEVVVLDAYNNPLPLTCDPETGIYSVPIANTVPITAIKKEVALEAAKAEALFSIRAMALADLREIFSTGSQAYADIISSDPVVSSYKSYAFDEDAAVVDSFYAYSDTLFSARVTVKLDVKNKKGKVTSYVTTATYLFSPNNAGNYMVIDRSESDMQQPLTEVRLTYVQDDVALLTQLVSTLDPAPLPPAVTDTQGQSPIAWGKKEADGSLTAVLILREDGSYAPVQGQNLEVMTLYPIYGEATQE